MCLVLSRDVFELPISMTLNCDWLRGLVPSILHRDTSEGLSRHQLYKTVL